MSSKRKSKQIDSDEPEITSDSDIDDQSSASSDNTPSFNMYTIPVQKRIGAVKKLHLDFLKQREAFLKEEAELRQQFEAQFQELFKKRDQIIKGDYEPAEEELATSEATFGTATQQTESTSETTVSGVPKFWKNCFDNSKTLKSLVHLYDIPLLEHIISVTKTEVSLDEEGYNALKQQIDPDMLPPLEKLFKLTLELTFSPNPYIDNTTITKVLVISHGPNEEIDVHNPPLPEEEDEDEEEEEDEKPRKKSKKAKKEEKPSKPKTFQWKEGKEIGHYKLTVTKKKTTGKGKKKVVKKTTEEVEVVLPSFFDLFLSRDEFVEKLHKLEECMSELEEPAVHSALVEKLQKEFPDHDSKDVEKDYIKTENFFQSGDIEDVDQQFSDAILFITDTLLPNAYHFFTGDTDKYEENIEDDFDDDDFDDEDDYDDDDDDDEDDD